MKSMGWIKLHRESLDSKEFQNPLTWKLWCWCLMRAAHKRHPFNIQTGSGETEVEVDEGQFIFGRNAAAQELNIKPSTIRNHMQKLKRWGYLSMQPNCHYTLVTIQKGRDCQSIKEDGGQATGQPNNRQRTTKGQQKDTYKNVKSVENDNNSLSKRKNTLAEQIAKFLYDLLREKDCISKEPDLGIWINKIEMILSRGRHPEEIKRVIRWALEDNHWKKVIIGTEAASKLLRHYDQLKIRFEDSESKEVNMLSTYYTREEYDFHDIQSVNEIIWGIQGSDESQQRNAKKILKTLTPGFRDLERNQVMLEIERVGNIQNPRLYLKKRFEEFLNEGLKSSF